MGPRFWLENITELFSTPSLVPLKNDSLEDQMNAVTRIVVLAFILCMLFNVYIDYRFLFGSILLVICAYYCVKAFQPVKEMKEDYGLVESVMTPPQPVPWNTGTNDMILSCGPNGPRNPCGTPPFTPTNELSIPSGASNPQWINTDQSLSWCPTNVPLEQTISENQQLVGPPNPKTLVRPVIPTPIYDFETWKPNDFVFPSGINDQRRQELFDNGYIPISRVDRLPEQPQQSPPPQHHSNQYVEHELPPREQYRRPHHEVSHEAYRDPPHRIPIDAVQSEEHYTPPKNTNDPYKTFSYPSINVSCGYDPTNLDYGLPVNYKANRCQKTDALKEYNENLFTIPLQPGLYTRSQVNQTDASQSNLGISMTQPFLPTAFQRKNGYNEFVELAEPLKPQVAPFPRTDAPLRTEIYDPRLTGYGTSYRTYIEPVTGQPRFYYDDIDQQTQYNYITKNDIDFAAFGTRAGPINNRSLQGEALTGFADQMYTDSQVSFRNEMQQRLMHKNSNREWQQRIAPISTMNQRRASGGMSSSSGVYAGPRG